VQRSTIRINQEGKPQVNPSRTQDPARGRQFGGVRGGFNRAPKDMYNGDDPSGGRGPASRGAAGQEIKEVKQTDFVIQFVLKEYVPRDERPPLEANSPQDEPFEPGDDPEADIDAEV
jgi:hypothetical protein